MHNPDHDNQQSAVFGLALAALGVVYGDIGTSPSTPSKEAFTGARHRSSEAHVLATLSAFFWAVLIIVSLKYVWVVLRFRQRRGGRRAGPDHGPRPPGRQRPALGACWRGRRIFAAPCSMATRSSRRPFRCCRRWRASASPCRTWNVTWCRSPVGILVGLFMIQKHGTGQVGRFFFGHRCCGFATLAALGCASIVETRRCCAPSTRLRDRVHRRNAASRLRAAVGGVPVLTGGGALCRHGAFRRQTGPVWLVRAGVAALVLVFRAGRAGLREPVAIENPFYLLAPDWFLLPLVGWRPLATVIASQASHHRRLFDDAAGHPASATCRACASSTPRIPSAARSTCPA